MAMAMAAAVHSSTALFSPQRNPNDKQPTNLLLCYATLNYHPTTTTTTKPHNNEQTYQVVVRRRRLQLGVRPCVKQIDTLAVGSCFCLYV